MAELNAAFVNLPRAHKRMLALLVVAGGVTMSTKVRSLVLDAQRKQKALAGEVLTGRTATRKSSRVSVNRVFFKRLVAILSICVPSPFSKEAALILIQGVLLVSRTLLTDWISRIEGWYGAAITALKFQEFGSAIATFAAVGIPAALVNAGLKYMQKLIELAFQSRLTEYLHRQYCSNRAYYAAATLGGMLNPDQRITEDVEKFCFAISDLYAHTFKPLLDVVLFTRSLSRVMGYKGQFGLYAYYLLVAWLLRAMSPPMAQMTATESTLSGVFRSAHQRLVTYSEEVAFNDPPGGAAEQFVLNAHLRRLLRYSGLSALQRCVQQVLDGYFVKYFASVVAMGVYAAPLYFAPAHARADTETLTGDYIRSMRLLHNTSRGVGDLILVYKRVTNLASHTSRVAELLEQVAALSGEDAEHRELFRRNVSATHMLGLSVAALSGQEGADPPPNPLRRHGSTIAFYRVALDSPDGQPLFRELTFEVVPGRSVLLMGPNGCGKSSLFRVMAGLWPLQAGEITTPEQSRLFYLSQRPYLVTGTLRDQLLYPFPPRAVWAAATVRERTRFCNAAGREPPAALTPELDGQLRAALRAVELEYLADRRAGLDQVQSWQDTLSGGEKQRLAMARLLFHRPAYAVLDECTSAVSADGELKLYQACQAAGITFLSIAHRPALKRFHSLIIHFDANVSATGRGWWAEALPPPEPAAPSVSTPTAQPSLGLPVGGDSSSRGTLGSAARALGGARDASAPSTPTDSVVRPGLFANGTGDGRTPSSNRVDRPVPHSQD